MIGFAAELDEVAAPRPAQVGVNCAKPIEHLSGQAFAAIFKSWEHSPKRV
jgi:hypothetical protein